MTTRVHIGDLGCFGVDVDAWEKENRAPLFPGKFQRWVLARTDRDNPTDEDVERTLKAALGKWFAADPLDPLDPRGVRGLVDSVKVERISRTDRLQITDRAARRDDLREPPTVEAKNPVWVAASFAYRGTARDLPWPVRKGGAQVLSSATRCPVSADWILDQVGSPPAAEPPPRPSLGDALPAAAANVVNTAVFGTLGWPLAALGGLLGLVVLARRSR